MAKSIEKINVPDIGGATDVEVIEVFVKPGDKINADDSIITLESEKASMDVPAPKSGIVDEVKVKVGDKISEGSLILTLKTEGESAKTSEEEIKKEVKKEIKKEVAESVKQVEKSKEVQSVVEESAANKPKATATYEVSLEPEGEGILASPSVRRIASELELDLTKIKASGPKGRVTKEDVRAYVKQATTTSGSGFSLPEAPRVDFTKFGAIEEKPLSKINKLSGKNLARNWITIPHVTQFEEADITEMEAFRQEQKDSASKQGVKLTPLVFIMKAVVAALKEFPTFNASLDPSGETLILKKYFHIGVAVDTPNGLVVPVIRDVEKKGLFELAKELGEISQKAREKGLGLADMQGGCFSISSLGGIGGTAFTPIINAPEVAILGVSRSSQKPVYQTYGEFVPRLMLPLSLSYDHRVIDGAEAARFIVYLANRLADIRTLLL